MTSPDKPAMNRRSTDTPFDPATTAKLERSFDFIKRTTRVASLSEGHEIAQPAPSAILEPGSASSTLRAASAPEFAYGIFLQTLGVAGWILVLLFSLRPSHLFPPSEPSWELAIFMALAFVARILGFRVVENVRIALDTAIYVAGVFILGVLPAAWLVLLVLTVDTGIGFLHGAHSSPSALHDHKYVFSRLIRRGGVPALIILGLGAGFQLQALHDTPLPALVSSVLLFTLAFLVSYYVFVLIATRSSMADLFGRLVRAELTQVPIALSLVLGYLYGGLTLFLLLGLTALMFSGIFQRNALARRQIAKRLDELSTLNEVGKIISASLEIGPLLQHLATATLKLVGETSRFTVGLIHDDDFSVTHEIYDASGNRYRTLLVDRNTGLSGWVIRNKKPLLLGDVQREYSLYAQSEDKTIERFSSWLCVPIVLYDETIGVMSVQSDQTHAYTPGHLRVLTTIADQAAVAIENARLYEANAKARMELSERVDELSTLNEVGKIISAILERKPLAEHIATATLRLVGESSRFMICFGQENSDEMTGALFDHTGSCYEEFSARTDQSLSGWVMANRKPLLMGDVQTEYQQYLNNYAYNDSRFHSWLCVPLIYNNEVRGSLSVQSEGLHAYTEDHLRVLTNIADQAAVAFENTRLYELATVDGLTGLYVRRHFDQRMLEEWERASRGSTDLSLLLLDLDGFKAINDTYGHQAGDAMLRTAADSVQRHLRTSDLPCRYGGDEFAVILPATDMEGARLVGERIRAEIARAPMAAGDGEIILTCSIGVASYPGAEIASPKDLIQRADTALYEAKEQGRNCVVISGEPTANTA